MDAVEDGGVVQKRPKPRPLALRRHAQLVAPEHGRVLSGVSVGPHGEAVALWTEDSGRGGPPSGPTSTGSTAHVVSAAPRSTEVVAVAFDELPDGPRHLQPLPGGRFLVVGDTDEEGGPPHAVVLAPDGTIARRGRLGHGISHVQTTPSGRIWVGYTDEGIYGSDPLASPGIVRFSSRFEPEWRFPEDVADPVDECYALNVVGETAWASYYDAFPVVRIVDGAVRSWPQVVKGAEALVVEAGRCALIGGYRERGQIVVGELDRGNFAPYRLTLPDGEGLPDRAVILGRGADVHVFVDTAWYRLGLGDMPGA